MLSNLQIWITLPSFLLFLLLDYGINPVQGIKCWTCDQGRPNDTDNNLCNTNATESSVQCEPQDKGCLVVVKRVIGLFHIEPEVFKSCNRNSFWSVNLPDCGNLTVGFELYENCVCNHEDDCNKLGILDRGIPLEVYLERIHTEIEEEHIEEAVENIDSFNSFENTSIIFDL